MHTLSYVYDGLIQTLLLLQRFLIYRLKGINIIKEYSLLVMGSVN